MLPLVPRSDSRPLTNVDVWQAWGITVGATVLQNELSSRLPSDFLASLPSGVEISYAAIPQIRALGEPLKDEVRDAFADSLDVLWEVMIAVSGVGFLSAWIMRGIPLQQIGDENWGLKEREREREKQGSAEAGAAAAELPKV